ncbi:hypothetical protein OKW24_004281 [Peribacillus simplex]|nr:hypothetical protein [Peribacillus simplex]
MIQKQTSMVFSPYMAIYDVVVSKDNMLRKTYSVSIKSNEHTEQATFRDSE